MAPLKKGTVVGRLAAYDNGEEVILALILIGLIVFYRIKTSEKRRRRLERRRRREERRRAREMAAEEAGKGTIADTDKRDGNTGEH